LLIALATALALFQPVVAVLARKGLTRRDGERIDVDHIVANRIASDLLVAKVMDAVRSAAYGLHPRRDLFAIVPAVVRVRERNGSGQLAVDATAGYDAEANARGAGLATGDRSTIEPGRTNSGRATVSSGRPSGVCAAISLDGASEAPGVSRTRRA
jgi:hypothetical protein